MVNIFVNTNLNVSVTNYRLEVMIWNKDVRWGYMTVKLHGNGKEAVATIDQ